MTATIESEMPIGSIIPLLIPPNYSDWYTLAGIAPRFPRVDIKAIVDTKVEFESGPADPTYQAGIGMLKNAGVEVLALFNESFNLEHDIWRLKAIKEFYPDISGIAFNIPSVFEQIDHNQDMVNRIAELTRVARNGFETIVLLICVPSSADQLEKSMSHGVEKFLTAIGQDNFNIAVLYFLEGEKEGEHISPRFIGDQLKKEWMKSYTPDRFGMIVSPQSPLRQNDFRNQIYAIYANKIARYIYIKRAGDIADQNLSSYFESTAHELDKLAESEGKQRPPGWKMTGYDMTPNTVGVGGSGDTHPGGADGTAKKDIRPGWRKEFDYMGVEKLYPDIGPEEISTYRMGPIAAPHKERGDIWTDSFSRGIENVEYTVYIKRTDGKTKKTFDPHEAIYTFSILNGKDSGYCATITHGGFAEMRKLFKGKWLQPRAAQGTNHSLREWLGFKFVFYQFWPPDFKDDVNKKHVKLELWMDENCTTQDGGLHVANKWRLVQETTDTGNWVYPKGTKKIPKDGYLVVNGEMDHIRLDFNRKIKKEVAYASVRLIIPPKAD